MNTVKEILKVKQVEIETDIMPIDYVTSSFAVGQFLQKEIGSDTQECLILLCLNTKNKVTHYSVVHRGRINDSLAVPRDIYQRAILSNAARIIISHNHPSQDVTPSKQDDLFTKNIVKSGKILGIPVLDHIIVSDKNYFSYRENTNLIK